MWQHKWVIGNWKMNGSNATNQELLQALLKPMDAAVAHVYCGVAVPNVYLAAASAFAADTALAVGAEDVSRFAANGAFTGEVNARMLADVGAQFVLIGHSERRQYFQEDNEELLAKVQNSVAAGVLPILCVGETLAEREAGQEQQVVSAQLALLAQLGLKEVVVAYEPVWAIGTGKVPDVAQIADMHELIYQQILSLCGEDVKIRVLYGGSVNASNAAEILAVSHVDGALVGGASLQADSFTAIIQAAYAPA
ncbi:triose-phosphate isomerase [Snodgrassella alvi]|uniref:Triosephosphate isomerase n=1 Tax=Snodgrassella alvi TaxID=1196083 RepID=A0A2N9XZD0_9NEIS|nr:triose-phosphate isomerase [Snodgrassella alvi]PIT54008.1 triose-phosphate isomerase [Snodgrassella alvi]PIT56638.1 triose-phosphate isomerase [Snodgrassella alvi]